MAVLTFAQAFGGGGGAAPAAAPAAPAPAPAAAPQSGRIVPLGQAAQFFSGGQQQPGVQQQPAAQPSAQPAGQQIPAGQGPSGPSDLALAGMSNSILQRFGRGANALMPGLTRNIGGSGLNLSDISGPLGLASGISSGNPLQITGGGLSTLSTLARLANFPGVSAAIGSLGGPLSLYAGIKSGDPMGIASGVLGSYGALSTLSALAVNAGLIPTALPSLSAAAGSLVSSLAGTAVGSALGVSSSTIATASATAAAGNAAAGGLAAGAGATVGLALAPIALAYLGISIGDMIQGPKDAKALEQKAKNTFARFPEQLANLKSSVGLLQALDTASPQQAAQIYDRLSNIMTGYRESGMENVLERGRIQSNTKTLGGSETISVKVPQAAKMYQQITPYLQAITYGQLRAQDAAARGGVSVSNPRSATDYAMDLGRTMAHANPANLESGLAPTYNDYLNTYYASPSQALTAELRDQIERNAQPGENPLHVAAVHPAETIWDPGAANVLAGFKPGSYEESLRALTGYESTNPFFSAAAKRSPQPTNWITTPSPGSTPHAWMTDSSTHPRQAGIGGGWVWDGNNNKWTRDLAPVSAALSEMRTTRQASGAARTQADTAAAAAAAPGAWADHSIAAAAAAAEAEAVRAAEAATVATHTWYNPPAP